VSVSNVNTIACVCVSNLVGSLFNSLRWLTESWITNDVLFDFITVMYPLNSQCTVCVWGNIYRYILILCIIWWLCIHSILDWRIIKLLIIELIICALMCPVLLYVFVYVTVCIVFYVYSILWCLFYCIYLSFSKYTLKICSLVFGLFCLT